MDAERAVMLSHEPPPITFSNYSAYGVIDGGDSAIHPRPWMSSMYDGAYSKPKLPRHMRTQMRGEGLPRIRGAERHAYGAPKAAWASPRSGQQAVTAARQMSPRVLAAPDTYYG